MSAQRAPVTALVAATLTLAAMALPVMAQDEPDDAPATQLRLTLDHVLAEHALLHTAVMRTSIDSGSEYDAAAAALDENSTSLVGAIESIYGADAAEAFGAQWRNHIAYLVDYQRALADDDTAAAGVADEQLQAYIADFSHLLATAIPSLPEDAVQGLIAEHVDQLEQVAAIQAEAFGDAYPVIRETYHHMFDIGDSLAVAISGQFPDTFTGREHAFSPAIDLRIAIDRLLSEHTGLAWIAMRAALSDDPDVESAATALEGNSAELATTIASVYGDAAGDAFGDLWRRHTGLYLDYVSALADGDQAALDQAGDGLRDYRTEFTDFLADANPYLSADEFETLVGEHTAHLIDEADAFEAGNFADAYEIGREAFAHSGRMAAGLAAAIADQFPQRFPDTATQAPASTGNDPVILVGVLLAAIALVLVAVRRVPRQVAGRVTSPRSGRPRPNKSP